MVVKSWTDCSTPNSLEETHRLRRCAFMLSISAVNARIDVASGLLLCASSRAFCVGSKCAWNWRTAVARASIPWGRLEEDMIRIIWWTELDAVCNERRFHLRIYWGRMRWGWQQTLRWKKQFTASVWLLTPHEAHWMVSRDVAPGLTMTCSIRIMFALVLLIGSKKNAHETRKDIIWTLCMLIAE